MDLNFKFGSEKATMSKTQLVSAAGNFWQRIYKIIFVILLFLSSLLGAYLWQRSLSGGMWSDEKKQEYLNANSKGIVFNETKFRKALADVELRKQETKVDTQNLKNIFKAY